MAKRETVTDLDRAAALLWRMFRRMGDPTSEGDGPKCERFRYKWRHELACLRSAIRLGRALATKGGKPGKGKARKGARR